MEEEGQLKEGGLDVLHVALRQYHPAANFTDNWVWEHSDGSATPFALSHRWAAGQPDNYGIWDNMAEEDFGILELDGFSDEYFGRPGWPLCMFPHQGDGYFFILNPNS